MMEKERKTILIFGPPFSSVGGVVDHVRTLLHSPLRDTYNLIHFTVGSKKGTSLVMPFRIILRVFILVFLFLKKRVDVVHINTSLNFRAFWRDAFFLLVIKCMRRKVLFQIHGGKLDEFWSTYNRFFKLMVKRIFRSADVVTVLSEEQKKSVDAVMEKYSDVLDDDANCAKAAN